MRHGSLYTNVFDMCLGINRFYSLNHKSKPLTLISEPTHEIHLIMNATNRTCVSES